MKKILVKTGWFFASLFPIFILIILQMGIMVIAMVVCSFLLALDGASAIDVGEKVQKLVTDNLLFIVIASQVLSALIGGCWYYFIWGKEKTDTWRRSATVPQILLIPILGVLVQFMTSSVLTVIDILFPSVMESYSELMETSGLNEVTATMLISTAIMAPLCEEILCRGLVLRLAQKVSARFWVINIVQAFAFGVMHGNLVQGSYAFFLGLILGSLYKRFGNIWLCMLLHSAINLSSILVEPVFSLFPEKYPLVSMAVTFVVSFVLFALVMFLICYYHTNRLPQSGKNDIIDPLGNRAKGVSIDAKED